MEYKLSIILVGILGTLFSFVMDNNDMLFEWARWVPVVLSTAFIIWQWRKKAKDE